MRLWGIAAVSVLALAVAGCGQAPATVTAPRPTLTPPPSTPLPTATSGEFVTVPYRAAAAWEFQRGFASTPSSTELLVTAKWKGCGPTVVEDPQPRVTYAASTVTLTVWGVRPPDDRPGTYHCPNRPGTPVTVPLTEPLGNRTLEQGDAVVR